MASTETEADAEFRAYVRSWLSDDKPSSNSSPLFPDIQRVFQEAVDRFSSETKRNASRLDLTSSAASIEEIQKTVLAAIERHEGRQKQSRVRQWLGRVMPSVSQYKSAMRILGQVHPEYVALLWGMMSLVFDTVRNSPDTICLLSRAFAEIADALPQAELSAVLYPTERMRRALGDLYVKILRFFIQAYDWCHEGSFQRLLHGLAQPPELRYQEILQDITASSRQIDQLSQSSSRGEVREIGYIVSQVQHSLRQMGSEIGDVKALMANSFQDLTARQRRVESLISSSSLQTNQRLDDMQFSQCITSLSDTKLGDPLRALRFNQWLQNHPKRKRAPIVAPVNRFWQSPKLQIWTTTPESSVIAVTGDWRAQPIVRRFTLNMIQYLQSSKVTTLWALQPPEVNVKASGICAVDIMKHLVAQALQLQQGAVTERGMSRTFAQFNGATTESEWFQLLGSILAQVQNQVYIVIDLYTLDQRLLPTEGVSWLVEFRKLFSEFQRVCPGLHVKVLLLGGSSLLGATGTVEDADIVVPVKVEPVPIRRRRQIQQLRGKRL